MSDLTTVIAARIRQCRNRHGWTIKETIEPIPEVSSSQYSNWEQGIRRPKLEEVIKLANRFGESPQYLAGLSDHSGHDANKMKFISVSNATIPVGGAIIALEGVTDSSALNLEYIKKRGLNENKLTTVLAPDDTMADVIQRGDEILIDRNTTNVSGVDIFALMVNGHVWFRWIKPELNGTFTVSAEDKTHHPDQTLSKDELLQLQIIGRVSRICRDR